MILSWDANAWQDYLYWQETDRAMLRRIHALLKECLRTPFEGIGKPEALKGNLRGAWSRRIDHEHRLVYQVLDQGTRLHIVRCRHHYEA